MVSGVKWTCGTHNVGIVQSAYVEVVPPVPSLAVPTYHPECYLLIYFGYCVVGPLIIVLCSLIIDLSCICDPRVRT